MIAPWTFLMVVIVVTFTADIRTQAIPMMNKEACVNAAKIASASSSGNVGYICISSETGETIKFGNQK